MSTYIRKILSSSFCLVLVLQLFLIVPPESKAMEGEITYTGINTNIAGDDGHSGGNQGPYNIGFTFDFYGTNYTQANVNINGVLNMGNVYTTGYSNTALNQSNAFANSIFAFWDDLNTNGGKIIYYATIGAAPNRKFVVQWTNIYFHGTSVQMGTFQTILYEGTNEVQIQYRDLLGGDRALGNSATIGIKKDNSTFSQYSSNTASLTAGQAIRYTPDGAGGYTVNTAATYDLIYLAPEGAPTSPTLVNPTDNTTGVTLRPTFEWLPVESATSYRVLVSTVSNFSSTVVNQSGVTGTSYTLASDLSASTQYYWRVQAVNADGSSLSSTRTFTTGSSNTAPNLPTSVVSGTLLGGGSLSDVSGAELSMVLSDDDVGEQVRYRLQIATDTNFSELVIDYRSPFAGVGAATYTFAENSGTYLLGAATTTLEADTYYLRVRAEDDAAASSGWYQEDGAAFLIVADETAPVLSSISASPSQNSVVVEWNTNEAASSWIEYGPSSSYTASTSIQNVSPRVTEHSLSLSSLQPCVTYHFQVASADAAGNIATSSDRTFTTKGCTGAAEVVEQVVSMAEVSTSTVVSLVNEGKGIGIRVPENYANASLHFQLKKISDTAVHASTTVPANLNFVAGHSYTLHAVTSDLALVSEFEQPIEVTVTYLDSDVSSFSESTLVLYRWNVGTDSWTELTDCTVNATSNTVTCTTDHFSTFSLFGAASTAESEEGDSRAVTFGYVRYGCKDKNAVNYEYFAAHKPELCQYESTSQTIQAVLTVEQLINQNRDLFLQAHKVGIVLPQSIRDLLGITTTATISVRNLELGMEGDDVKRLQSLLVKEGYAISAGVTGYFGLQTQYALDAYQQASNINPRGGYFGPITRTHMQSAGLEGLWW